MLGILPRKTSVFTGTTPAINCKPNCIRPDLSLLLNTRQLLCSFSSPFQIKEPIFHFDVSSDEFITNLQFWLSGFCFKLYWQL